HDAGVTTAPTAGPRCAAHASRARTMRRRRARRRWPSTGDARKKDAVQPAPEETSGAMPAPGGVAARWPRRRIATWLALAVVASAAAVLLARVDWTALDAEAIAERVRAAGAVGPFVLVVLLILQCI